MLLETALDLLNASHSFLYPPPPLPPPISTALGGGGPAEPGGRARAALAVDGGHGAGWQWASLDAGDAHRAVGAEPGPKHGGAAPALHFFGPTGSAARHQREHGPGVRRRRVRCIS